MKFFMSRLSMSGERPRQTPSGGRQASVAPKSGSVAVTNVLGAVRRKYGNVPTVVDGVTFDSKREAERYLSLRDDFRAGRISDLEVHPRFPLVVHEQDCGVYEGDFAYIDAHGVRVVEDVKSAATRKLPTYRLKAKLVWALYGLRVREV